MAVGSVGSNKILKKLSLEIILFFIVFLLCLVTLVALMVFGTQFCCGLLFVRYLLILSAWSCVLLLLLRCVFCLLPRNTLVVCCHVFYHNKKEFPGALEGIRLNYKKKAFPVLSCDPSHPSLPALESLTGAGDRKIIDSLTCCSERRGAWLYINHPFVDIGIGGH